MVPTGDKILVGGLRGQRVVGVTSNVMAIELKEGDEWVEVKKLGYKPQKRQIPEFKHGESVGLTVYLEQEL